MTAIEPMIGTRFTDIYGDMWIYIGQELVKRLKDGNIGGWHDGKGLEL